MNSTFWDERYAGEEFVYGTTPNDFLAAKAHLIKKGAALCLADGEGRNGVYLAEQGHRVTTVDSSAEGVAKARKLAAARGVELTALQEDLAEYDFPENQFSAIVSIFCHLPPELRAMVLKRSVAALQSGGLFIFEGYTPDQLKFKTGGPKDETLLVRIEQLKSELAGLEFLHAEEIEREVVEGSFHTGHAAVAQLIGRKP